MLFSPGKGISKTIYAGGPTFNGSTPLMWVCVDDMVDIVWHKECLVPLSGSHCYPLCLDTWWHCATLVL